MANWFRESMVEGSAPQWFNGIRAIQLHLEQRSRIEDYVSGESKEKIDLSSCCRPDCMVGQWLHSEGGKCCKDLRLLDLVTRSCEEFHEAAAQAVLLADMGKSEMAKSAIGQIFYASSAAFQLNLAKLYRHQEMMAREQDSLTAGIAGAGPNGS